jgi:prevent-host-death family protein
MRTVAITDFKAKCLGLLEDVARTGEPLIVTKHGKALARVIPNTGSGAGHPQESLTGSVTVLGDVVEPVLPAEAWDANRGELMQRARTKGKRRR